MFRNDLISVLVVFGITVCGTASSAVIKYNFSHSGFADGGIVTGMFAGEDVNDDGFLVGNEGSAGSNEITDFNMAFSGNSIVPAFALGFDNFRFLVYRLDGGPLGDSDGELIAASSDFDTAGLYIPQGFSTGTDIPDECKNSYCAVVFVPGVKFEPNYSFELVTVNAVPLPAAIWLFGSGLFGLIGMRPIKSFCKTILT